MISRRLLPKSKFLSLSSPLRTEGGYYEEIWDTCGHYSIALVRSLRRIWSLAPTLHAQAPFYQGKSIRLIIGSQAGSLYDGWARLFANHMGKHIAGNPAIVGQNMAGAGSVIAANQIYNVAKPDGLTIGALLPGIYIDQLIGRKEAQFDWARFNWIGTPEQTEWVLVTRRDSPYKSIEDIRAAKEPPKCGSTGTGSFLYLVPKLMEESLGTKFTMITGYQGGPDVDLAMERGEVHCRAVSTTAYFSRQALHYLGKEWICSSPGSDREEAGNFIDGCLHSP